MSVKKGWLHNAVTLLAVFANSIFRQRPRKAVIGSISFPLCGKFRIIIEIEYGFP